MSFRKAEWPRTLRSQAWYGGDGRDAIYHRSWMKNQGLPADLFDGRPVMKLSPDKVSLPGAKQVYRTKHSSGMFAKDIIALDDEELPGGLPLLEEVMKDGRRTGPPTALEDVRMRFQEDFSDLEERFKVLKNPPRFPVSVSGKLERLTAEVREKALGVNVSDSD